MRPSTVPPRIRRAPRGLLNRLSFRYAPLAMSAIRKRWVKLRNPHAKVVFGKHCFVGPGFSLHAPDGGTFIAGRGVEFRRNFRAEIVGDGRIVIGDWSYLTYNVLIACSTVIEIGERCGVGFCSQVYDGNHRYRDLSKPFLAQGYEFRPVRIEDGAQVHGLCTVLNTIGERAVIGANAVVTRPIPAFTLAVGAPARPIDYFGPEERRPDGVPAEASPG